jgi:hypothetical protein
MSQIVFNSRYTSAISAYISVNSVVKGFFVFILIFLSINIYSQEANLSEVIVSIAEELAADESDPEAVGLYIEKLHELAEDPVRINSSTEDEVSRLFFLTDFQIKAIIDYAHSSGRIVTVYEIANIPGFDRETTEMIVPFITIEDKVREISKPGKFNSTVLTNLSVRSGGKDTTDLGSQLKLLSKYKFIAGSFSGGFTIEKDAGEKFLSSDTKRPDFLSSWMAYNGKGFIKRIIIGDFSARFGQGTNINTGMRMGLSLTSPGYMSAGSEIRPYTSTDENNFFRGMASEFSFKDLTLSLVYSANQIDATSGSGNGQIESFYTSGLHNTSSLMLKKDMITDHSYGISVSYNRKNLRTGMIWSEDRLSLPLVNESPDPQSIYNFSGNRNSLYSFYYNFLVNKFLLYGEISLNESFRHSLVQGITLRLSGRLSVNFLYRDYQPGYYSLHGKGPGGNSGTGNLRGLTGNFTFEAARHLFISAGCDLQYYPWLKYRSDSPSSGIRQEIRMKYLPSDKLTLEVLYNFRSSMNDDPDDTGVQSHKELRTNNIRGSVRYSPVGRLMLGTRMDYKTASPGRSTGVLLYQDLTYSFSKAPVTFWFRYCLFSTESWDTRLYTYENDLLYSFSVPALAGEGSRRYFMVKWSPGDHVDFRFKYGITSISESSSYKNSDELKFQVKINF